MSPNITCRSMLGFTRTASDPRLVELTRMKMKEKWCEKASSRAESTRHLAQTSESVTTTMSQPMSVKCTKILRRPSNGIQAIVGDEEVLQQARIRNVLWTTGMCGRQMIEMKHDTRQTGVRLARS